MTEMQLKFQKERDRANKILDSMTVGERYGIELDSMWTGMEYYRGNDGFYFYFSKSKTGRKSKLEGSHLISAQLVKEAHS